MKCKVETTTEHDLSLTNIYIVITSALIPELTKNCEITSVLGHSLGNSSIGPSRKSNEAQFLVK